VRRLTTPVHVQSTHRGCRGRRTSPSSAFPNQPIFFFQRACLTSDNHPAATASCRIVSHRTASHRIASNSLLCSLGAQLQPRIIAVDALTGPGNNQRVTDNRKHKEQRRAFHSTYLPKFIQNQRASLANSHHPHLILIPIQAQ